MKKVVNHRIFGCFLVLTLGCTDGDTSFEQLESQPSDDVVEDAESGDTEGDGVNGPLDVGSREEDRRTNDVAGNDADAEGLLDALIMDDGNTGARENDTSGDSESSPYCVEGAACDDDDPCSATSICQDGLCVGVEPACDDGVSCTENLCDDAGDCSFPLLANTCFIDGVCYSNESYNPDDGCFMCLSGVVQNEWVPPVEECNGIDDDCDGLLDEGCDLYPQFMLYPATPSPGQPVVITLVDDQFHEAGELIVAGDCGSLQVLFYGVTQDEGIWSWSFGLERVPHGSSTLEFRSAQGPVSVATIEAGSGNCQDAWTPYIEVDPSPATVGSSLEIAVTTLMEWGDLILLAKDNCGDVEVNKMADGLFKTGPVGGGLVVYSVRDGLDGPLILHGTIPVAGSPFCSVPTVGDLDGDDQLDLEDNCPSVPNSSQHDQDGDGIGDVCDPWPAGGPPEHTLEVEPEEFIAGEPAIIRVLTTEEWVGLEAACSGPCDQFGGLFSEVSGQEAVQFEWELAILPAVPGEYLCTFSILGGGPLPQALVLVGGEPPCEGCGDGVCAEGENCETCAIDCDCDLCGNGLCEPGENCSMCSLDCACPFTCPAAGIPCAFSLVSAHQCDEEGAVGIESCETYGVCSGVGGNEMCSWGTGSWCQVDCP